MGFAFGMGHYLAISFIDGVLIDLSYLVNN